MMFISVFVVMMGFRRSVRMGSSVHAKKNLPHQLLKDKGRLQSVKIIPSSVIPSEAEGSRHITLKIADQGTCRVIIKVSPRDPSTALGMTGAVERAILQCDGRGYAQIATNRLRRAHGSLDPHPICDRRVHLSDGATGGRLSAFGRGSKRRYWRGNRCWAFHHAAWRWHQPGRKRNRRRIDRRFLAA